MAHSLGMSAICEWVETAAQVEIVRSFNADAAQGFFFARPMSSTDAALLACGPDIPQFSRTQIRTLTCSLDGRDAPDGIEGPEPQDAEAAGADALGPAPVAN
jgi:hypothetical protein